MRLQQAHAALRQAAISRAAPSGQPRAGDLQAALDLVRLGPLIERSRGSPEVRVGLVDGPVALDHPHLAGAATRGIAAASAGACSRADSDACRHGTLVAGALVGTRESGAPAICPDCTLLIRPIFLEAQAADAAMPVASMEEVAAAIVETVDAGACVVNLSVALAEPSSRAEALMQEALDYAARRGAIVVAAAGNQGTLGSSAITRHPWVIAVVACDLSGRPTTRSNLSHSAGRRGLAAPGEGIASLAPRGALQAFSGTSAAAPFVTGTVALLKSLVPSATGGQLRFAVARASAPGRTTLVPPLLDGVGAWRLLSPAREPLAS